MHFTSFQEGDKLTIALTGEIDHHCAKAYIQVIAAKIETYMPEICVLDYFDHGLCNRVIDHISFCIDRHHTA